MGLPTMRASSSTPTKTASLRSIERELGVLLHRVRQRTAKNAAAVDPALQPAAFPVLVYIVDNDAAYASEIVEHFGIDKGAVSRHVVHLESLGLVTRTCDLADRRAQVIVATDHGRSRIDAVRAERRKVVASRLTDWSAGELDDLADLLARYNSSLESIQRSE